MRAVKLTQKRLTGSLLVAAVAVLAALLAALPSEAAHPAPAQAGRPESTGIPLQEVRFGPAHFAGAGSLHGLTAGPSGLTVAQGQTEGVYVSEPVASPLPFTTDVVPLWGVDLPEGAGFTLELRHRLEDGSWGDWLEIPPAFYPVRDNLYSGNLIWVGRRAAALQFKASLRRGPSAQSPTLSQLIFAFSDTSAGPSDVEIAGRRPSLAAASADCPVSAPDVVSRSEWGVPDYPYRYPVYAPVTHVIIHQSETPNNTNPYQDWAGWVRSIWNFHANVLGWGDVGYNYLIDPNGVIYEGRAGGDDVVGIHDGYNWGSMGLGFIGCYGDCDDPTLTVAEPSQDMLDSAAELIAWKFDQNGIDPFSTGFYAGKDVPVIAGGRDVTRTTSPGENVYNKLPDLRAAVDARINCQPPPTGTPTPTPTDTPTPTPTPAPDLQPCQITAIIFNQDRYATGDPINITVRLADYLGVPLSGAQVTATVEKTLTVSQAPTGFGLVDRTGEYDGVYTDTSQPGEYRFTVTAADTSGARFAPCTATETVQVGDPAATPTPDPTPTTGPIDNFLTFDPQQTTMSLSDAQATNTVVISNVTGLTAVAVEVAFNPAVVQAQAIRPNSLFTGGGTGIVARSEIDNTAGRLYFDAALLAPNEFNGQAGLLEIDWTPQAEGTSPLLLENVVLLAGTTELTPTIGNGSIEVTSGVVIVITGQARLQGRTSHAGVLVSTDGGPPTQTGSNGVFSVAGGSDVRLQFPGYLSARAALPAEPAAAGGSIRLGTITLLAGDTNGDDVIDILDLAYLASHYRSTDATADLNGDGRVDILDLALAAGNYSRQGPLTEWQ